MTKKLSSRERMEKALNLDIPDFVPIAPHLGCGYSPKASGYTISDFMLGDNQKIAEIYIKAHQKHPADWIYAIGGRTYSSVENLEEVRREAGHIYVKDKAKGKVEEYPVDDTWPYGHEHITMDEAIASYKPELDADRILASGAMDAMKILTGELGDEVFIAGQATGPFHTVADFLLGLDQFCLAMYDEPDKVNILLERAVDESIAMGEALVRAGAAGIVVVETSSSADIISPAMYREKAFEYEKKLIGELKKKAYVIME